MLAKWLVCLSLLVAGEAASLTSRFVEIPVQVVYDSPEDVNQARQATNLKNLAEKPQLSIQEQAESEILHFPEVVAKISEEKFQDKQVNNDDSGESNSSSSEEKETQDASNENKSVEDSREEESNEINNDQDLKVKFIAPEQVEIIEVPVVIQEADTPQVQEVGKVETVVSVRQAEESSTTTTTSTTTPRPNRPLLSFINRLGENLNSAINSIRPTTTTNTASSTNETPALPVAAAEVEPTENPAVPSSSAPNFIGNLQHNVNNQLGSFSNRVNTFINNLRPKQPEAAQSEEETSTPNTPFLNGIQTQFNEGLTSFQNNVNTAFNYLNQNTPQQSDEQPGPSGQNNNPVVQAFLNGAATFQQTFTNFVQGAQSSNQQSDESSPGNTTNSNIGTQVLQVFQNGLNSVVQNFRPNSTNTQSEEETSTQGGIAVGFQNFFSNIGQQFTNIVGGTQNNNNSVQGIPANLPGVGQVQNLTSQIPGANQFQTISGQIPGVNQFQNFPNQIPGANQIQNFTDLIPGVDQFQNLPTQIPGANQIQNFADLIPGVDQFQNLPAQIPGANQIQNFTDLIPGADQFQNLPTQIPVLPEILPNPVSNPPPANPEPAPVHEIE